MSLEQKVNEGIKVAMKAKDDAGLRGLRAIKSAILIEKTSGSKSEMNEADEMKLLQKLVKQRKDSFEIFQTQGRTDLADREKEEIEVIEKFLPKQMGEDEIREQLKVIIAQTGAHSPADIGKIMGMAMKQFAGKADGKTISTLAKELLS